MVLINKQCWGNYGLGDFEEMVRGGEVERL